MRPKGYDEVRAEWERAVAVRDSLERVGAVMLVGGIGIFLAPLLFVRVLPEWTIVPAAIAGVGLLVRIVGGLWPVPDMPPSPSEVARRQHELRESLPQRRALAESTDTPKHFLRDLAEKDPDPGVRRAALETLALLNQAGF